MNNKEEMFNDLIKEAQLIRDYKIGKIDINDEIIDSVPVVNFPFLSNEQCLKIRELSQEVLKTSKNKNNNNEVAILYDLNSSDRKTIVLGDKYGVNVFADADSYHLLNFSPNVLVICLHNHPSGSDFSMDDIMTFIKSESIKLMVLLPNDGGMFYIYKDEEYSRFKNIETFADIVCRCSPDAYLNGTINMNKLTYDEMVSISKEYIKESIDIGVKYGYAKPINLKLENNYELERNNYGKSR